MMHQPSEQTVALTMKGERYAAENYVRPHGCPRGVNPTDWRRAIEARAETLLDMVAALMAMLDQTDGDADAEPSEDFEPSLGWTGNGFLAEGMVTDDREADLDIEEWDGDPDKEPTMGWAWSEPVQGYAPWHADECELDHDKAIEDDAHDGYGEDDEGVGHRFESSIPGGGSGI